MRGICKITSSVKFVIGCSLGHDYSGLNLDGATLVHFLSELGEDGGIVHTAVPVVIQPGSQHGGDVLELGSLEDQQSELSSESMSYCGGGGGQHRHTEHRGVLGQAGHWAGLQGPRHLRLVA